MKKITISLPDNLYDFIDKDRKNVNRSNYISMLIQKRKLSEDNTLICAAKNEVSISIAQDWLNISAIDIQNGTNWEW